MWFLSWLWWWLLCDNSRENSATAAELWQTLCGQNTNYLVFTGNMCWPGHRTKSLPCPRVGILPTDTMADSLVGLLMMMLQIWGAVLELAFFSDFFLLLVGNRCLMTYESSSNTSLNWSTPEKSYTHPQPPRLCACISPTLHFSLNRRLKRKKRNTFFELTGRPCQIPIVCSQKSLTSK